MTTIQPHYGSPGIVKLGHVNPDNTMRKILEPDPKQDMDTAVKKMLTEALEPLGEYVPSDLLMAMLWSEGIRSYWRIARILDREKPSKEKREGEKEKERVKETVERVLVSIAKKMTGAQCTKAGAAFANLAKKVKPRQIVGDVLTDEQIAEIMAI